MLSSRGKLSICEQGYCHRRSDYNRGCFDGCRRALEQPRGAEERPQESIDRGQFHTAADAGRERLFRGARDDARRVTRRCEPRPGAVAGRRSAT